MIESKWLCGALSLFVLKIDGERERGRERLSVHVRVCVFYLCVHAWTRKSLQEATTPPPPPPPSLSPSLHSCFHPPFFHFNRSRLMSVWCLRVRVCPCVYCARASVWTWVCFLPFWWHLNPLCLCMCTFLFWLPFVYLGVCAHHSHTGRCPPPVLTAVAVETVSATRSLLNDHLTMQGVRVKDVCVCVCSDYCVIS